MIYGQYLFAVFINITHCQQIFHQYFIWFILLSRYARRQRQVR